MANNKLKELQRFVQNTADVAWQHKMASSIYDPTPTSFGTHLETMLSANSEELSILLNEIALEELKKQDQTPEPPDFSKYIRYNGAYIDHIEVFVGNKWVLVPAEANVNFNATTTENTTSFSVTITHCGNSAHFTSTENLESYQEHDTLLQGEKLRVEQQNDYVSKEEFDWMRLGGLVYNKTDKSIGLLGELNTLYAEVPKDFKRNYAYKISKITNAVGKPAKAGKIFQGAQKVSKNLKVLGPVGNILSGGTIGYEVISGTWDAHTVVDGGALLVVGAVALGFGAPVLVVGVAIYGILDYAFDISGAIDANFGRDSGFWDKKPIYSFPKDNKPLFTKTAIDKTYVAPKLKLPLKFKD
ncbi:MAG: hypothetical protein L3J23_00415 [Flavobacteriaceae bacterium]|nr:hypothetical protein [Flavobacteriaceae bacterium]